MPDDKPQWAHGHDPADIDATDAGVEGVMPPAHHQPGEGIEQPPTTFSATLRKLGPGIIIAGAIVGSGELIATTKVGAQAGFWLLWLIIVGCLIKVFVQVELGRYTILHRKTTLYGLDTLPGPRLAGRNLIIWYWLFMSALVLSQQGGIVGGVGQAMAISIPVTSSGREYNDLQDAMVTRTIELAGLYRQHPELIEAGVTPTKLRDANKALVDAGDEPARAAARRNLDSLHVRRARILGSDAAETQASMLAVEQLFAADYLAVKTHGPGQDSYIWAALVAIATAAVLWFGRYQFIQTFSMVLVISFTLITIISLLMLQLTPTWAISGAELGRGLSFRLPPLIEGLASNPVATALGAFGIIGVGAGELIFYPYWCLEKGYARFTGPNDSSDEWLARARGWMRVLKADAWLSMVIYTFATIAFFLLGAATLGRSGLDPTDDDMIRTLAEMYVPIFGSWTQPVFLFGAFAVLYSTFFVVSASYARLLTDGLVIFRLIDDSEHTRRRWTRILSTAWPLVAAALFIGIRQPVAMVIASGVTQAIMLPMLGFAAIYFRYRRTQEQLQPSMLWDHLLWVSYIGLIITGSWALWQNWQRIIGLFS